MCIFALFLSIDMTSFRHIFVLELGFKQIHNPEALLAQFSANMLTNDKKNMTTYHFDDLFV